MIGQLAENDDRRGQQQPHPVRIVPTLVSVLAAVKAIVPDRLRQSHDPFEVARLFGKMDVAELESRRTDDLLLRIGGDEGLRRGRRSVIALPDIDKVLPTRFGFCADDAALR